MATGSVILNSLIGSGPFWSAIVPLVSSASKGAIDAIGAWQRDHARKRYEATFGILSGDHADLYEKIKNSFALIEACDEIARSQSQRAASAWRWLFVLGIMLLTGFRVSGASLAGDGLPDMPPADMVDPFIAAVGGFISPWVGKTFAALTGGSKSKNIRPHYGDGPAEVEALSYYANAREAARNKLIMALSEQIIAQADVGGEIAEIEAKSLYRRIDPRRYFKFLRRWFS